MYNGTVRARVSIRLREGSRCYLWSWSPYAVYRKCPFRCFSRHVTTLPTSRRNSSMIKLDDRTGSGSEVVTQMHILWISAGRRSSCQTLPSDDHFALSETRYVAVRSRSLESSGTVSDVTKTIHPYHFSSMLMELGWTTTMTRCALDPNGTL